ncbi:hypothetical protein, partial [Kyrpidia sp.]|uniref:hypothetical protein n=1 Tax=Kyrpidia sp. TaxID=2073077 RepID=UPI002590CBFE
GWHVGLIARAQRGQWVEDERRVLRLLLRHRFPRENKIDGRRRRWLGLVTGHVHGQEWEWRGSRVPYRSTAAGIGTRLQP